MPPTIVPVQNHIHLSTTIEGAPENAPSHTWVVTDRAEVPVVYIDVGDTLGAYAFVNKLLDENGNEINLTDFRFRVKVKDLDDGSASVYDRKALLKSWKGKVVYFVDSEHPNNGEDHSDYVRTMILADVGEFTSEYDKMLRFYYVDIYLKDASRLIS